MLLISRDGTDFTNIYSKERPGEIARGVERFLYCADVPKSEFFMIKNMILNDLSVSTAGLQRSEHELSISEAFNHLVRFESFYSAGDCGLQREKREIELPDLEGVVNPFAMICN